MAVPRALPLIELVDELRAGRIALPALLDAVKARGVLDEADYRAEVAQLEQMGEAGELDADVVLALIARLGAMRIIAARAPVDADLTVMMPAAAKPLQTPDPELTIVQVPSSPALVDEMTVVKPQAHGPTQAAHSPGDTSTHGTTSSLSSLGSWESIAAKEGGDYVTVGSLLKGRFHLERELGRGGMGVVYLAKDERKVEARDRDPYVAVKVLNDEFRRHPDSLIALQRESRRSQLLAHDNIVRVFDFDKDRTIVFMTMEYIDGSDLKSLIRERAYNGMPLAKARPLIEGMARALGRAHAAGIVHSDFKPGNVMVTRDGLPKVFDFGIARAGKFAGDASGEQTLFDAGTLGALTPAYASLEMIRGSEPSPNDDIYALGCVCFELLTGKHPFDKVSAEVVQKEGRKPPAVPGLTRRQHKTLCDSVALTSDQRLKNAEALIEGLREVGLKERMGPYVLGGSLALILLVGGGWGVSRYMHSHHLAKVIASFSATGKQRYANEVQAMQALATLDEDDRKRVIIDQGEAIQSYLLSRIDTYWQPSQQRFDYAGAQRVLALRDQLRLYSPALDMKRGELEQQRNELLNTLDTQLTRQIDAGAIFEDQPDNVVTTLARIRAVDPGSALLKNAELELKYDAAIGQSLAADRLDEAKQRLALATTLFPGSARLQQRGVQLAADEQTASLQQIATAAQAAPSTQSLTDARRELADLLAKPASTVDWEAAITRVATPLKNDNAPETQRLFDALGNTVADEAAKVTDPMQAQRTLAWVNFGLQYVPRSSRLLEQRGRLDGLQQQLEAQLAKDSVAAEIDSRIESMRRAAAANDVAKAQESLDRVRTLQPNAPFLANEGPQLLATAYLGQAKDAFQRGRYQGAADIAGQGTRALGSRADLRSARERYAFVSDLMQGGTSALTDADYDRLKKQLGDLRKTDSATLESLETDMKQRGQLPQGSFAARLEARKPAAALIVTPATASSAAPAIAPTANTPAAQTAKSTAAAVTATQTTATKAGVATGPDPCGGSALVGAGKVCSDVLDGKRGPSLVVVPGVGSGAAYAMSRAEITVNDFNRFCTASGQCHAITVDDPELGSLPVSNISLVQAKAYAAWLTSSTGFTYRLPSDAEWLHAAQAGQSWKQSEDSNCIPPTSQGADVAGAPVAARGREPNPWGLVNMSGNVWEWVTNDGATLVRGGSFNSYWSDCTVEARRTDSGTPQKDVGFRVLRELK
ncbi:bifunctional serine/threonine-protein kinase/formylglycine-generating enzyme family protein [Dyella terrae]|uniref:bifunctional serine/threonine-protein kinase/formylglycine-generating enzyme family protein n=1 Tax=Dyella terrae TaxID=522259 RepID=UPI001EFC487B|nr:bifunctional serine/threonine-protein kinase/formylglycine-generating enzyme family protein [Dyella terrae]ULU23808.1 SUMF1/EgtB/PvdO family nonheme iron enzyme [Dyella terrae]